MGIEKLRDLQALFDADAVIWRCGFACEKKDENGEVHPEPIEYCLHSVKQTIKNVLDLFHPDKEHRLFLGGTDNFRYKIATIQPYKGNRDPTYRPFHYDAIREYLTTYWNAEIVNGMEADDKVSMIQWATKDKSTCIVGCDKDLLNTPGHHYIWTKQEYRYQSLHDANLHFLHQLATGDRTDNIRGLDGVGEKTAHKIIAKHRGDYGKIKQELQAMYRKQHGKDGDRAMDETARLLWMTRHPDKQWSDYV